MRRVEGVGVKRDASTDAQDRHTNLVDEVLPRPVLIGVVDARWVGVVWPSEAKVFLPVGAPYVVGGARGTTIDHARDGDLVDRVVPLRN